MVSSAGAAVEFGDAPFSEKHGAIPRRYTLRANRMRHFARTHRLAVEHRSTFDVGPLCVRGEHQREYHRAQKKNAPTRVSASGRRILNSEGRLGRTLPHDYPASGTRQR